MTDQVNETDEIETDIYPRPEPALLTYEDIAQRTNQHPNSIRNHVASGRIPLDILRFGRSVRFSAKQFGFWCECNCPGKELFAARLRAMGEP